MVNAERTVVLKVLRVSEVEEVMILWLRERETRGQVVSLERGSKR